MNEEPATVTAIRTHNGVVLQGLPTRYIPGPTGKMSLVNKLCLVLKHCGAVPKTGFNKFHSYSYSTENDLTNALRGALAEQGVMLISGVQAIAIELVQLKSGRGDPKDGYSTVTMSSHLFIDGDSGEQLIFQFGGHSAKSDDKGIFANFTGALKYALKDSFLIPSEESEPERDENAAFTPDDQDAPKPQPGRYRTAADDPAVQERQRRENLAMEQEEAQKREDASRPRCSGVASAAARGGMEAELVSPEPKVGYPKWCGYVKTTGTVAKGRTLAFFALKFPREFKAMQEQWKPKTDAPNSQVYLRRALDASMSDPLQPEELEEVVKLQEGA